MKPITENDILYMTHEELMATKRILQVLIEILSRSDTLEDVAYHTDIFMKEVNHKLMLKTGSSSFLL